ncbi:hypothetical protein KJ841_02860 [Patescibacteria group bacterium]|nr:hypothetical protein [Patescibacteria group bacterium]
MNKKISTPIKRIITKLAILIIVSAFLACGLVIWQYFGVPEEEMKGEVVKDETTDWKTYRNEEYGFEIKYPANWHVVLTYPASGDEEKMKIKFMVQFRNTLKLETVATYGELHQIAIWIEETSISEWREGFSEIETIGTIEEIVVGVEKGYKAVIPKLELAFIGIPKNEYVYSIFQDAPSECGLLGCLIFQQMLSTFRFLE